MVLVGYKYSRTVDLSSLAPARININLLVSCLAFYLRMLLFE